MQIIQTINIAAGLNAHLYAFGENSRQIIKAERSIQNIMEEARLRHRQARLKLIEAIKSAENLLYSPGVDDST